MMCTTTYALIMGQRHDLIPPVRGRALLRLMCLLLCLGWLWMSLPEATAAVFTPEDVGRVRQVNDAAISPDGRWIAYTVTRQRPATDQAGGNYTELHVINRATGESRPFVTGEVNVSAVQWRPDSRRITFLSSRGDKAKTQVWAIPVDGGEAVALTHAPENIRDYLWHPAGRRLFYVAAAPPSPREMALQKKGYDFVYYEEDFRHNNLYRQTVNVDGPAGEAEPLTENITVVDMALDASGQQMLLQFIEKNLVDYRYMFKKMALLDLATGQRRLIWDDPRKLGRAELSPDGRRVAFTAARDIRDHAVSQVYVMPLDGGEPRNLTPPDFLGHLERMTWRDDETLLVLAGEGVWNTLSTMPAGGGDRTVIFDGRTTGLVVHFPSFATDFKCFVMIGETPEIPGDIFLWQPGGEPQRLTELNPWLKEKNLGRQEVIRYRARDGLEIEGLLVYPVDYQPGTRYPLVVTVHGGPEAHYSNGWLNRYLNPAQVLAGKGYLVFHPNYRSSTGYGVERVMSTYADPAGTEFDDVADGITYLIDQGLADEQRVGLGGGSYGGYAAAWFSSYYTRLVRAVCMFVGISNVASKRGTTDIPYEELYVHSGEKLEKMWRLSLERSPVYYAHQSKTAVLILGGTEDTRVHPSQSFEYYRRLKMNDHPAVRLVQYPGEGHGNRRQPGRIDVLYRTLQWYDWYVRDRKPLDGPMPPLNISDRYGLDLPAE
ncbi:MAG: S9 family peptidase [Acidobacteria bacterium]|nr:S9 family peptidase [Acidobacteriota bacterium]